MNFGYKGFRQAFTYSQKNMNFSGKFYKNLFKNKSVLFVLNSSLNKGKALINFSNKFFMQRAILVLKNTSIANRTIGSAETLLNGEEDVTEVESIENDKVKSFCSMDYLNSLIETMVKSLVQVRCASTQLAISVNLSYIEIEYSIGK